MLRYKAHLRTILSLAILLCVALGATTQTHANPEPSPTAEQNTILESYMLGVGDILEITIYGEPELSKQYRVAADGHISMPLIGKIEIQNRTIYDTQQNIQTRLSDGYLVNPSVSIEVQKYRPFYILGEVANPGSYDYVNHMNALNAVALAGGFTYRANRKGIKIIRTTPAGNETYKKAPLETKIAPGDVITIKERFF